VAPQKRKAFVLKFRGQKLFLILKNLIKECDFMVRPSGTEIQELAKEYNIIPICKEIYADIITPITLLRKISQISQKYYLFESIEDGQWWGRYSFLGFNPIAQVTCKNGVVVVTDENKRVLYSKKPLEELRKILAHYKAPKIAGMPPFTGGFVGYFSYEMIKYAEDKLNLKNNPFNDFDMMLFDKVIAYDRVKQKISIIVNMKTDNIVENYGKAIADIERIIRLIHEPLNISKIQTEDRPSFISNVSKEEFCKMVEKAKKYIFNGDIFQAVISRRFEAEYKDSLLNAYRVLRTTNPSPYMVFLQNEELQIISSSPETLVKLQDGNLSTFPIAGSRPRGKNLEEDKALEKELLQDEKELAEHNMLVDLARNDIGKISQFSSVRVTEYKQIKKYSKVMHIASQVDGTIQEGKDALDAIEALLPAGTLSGAPKIRACEIIEELEKIPRGIYGGAIGYIDFTGNMDTCIAIRMAVKQGSKVYVQAGAGIVADSVPEKEYEETENKAMAVMDAILRASEVDEL